MTAAHDTYETWDGAYVLGALTPADRRAYQVHLADCDTCREQVADLAGLPGLLAVIPHDVAISIVGDAPAEPEPPDHVLTDLVARTRRKRLYQRIGIGVAVAAAAVAIAVPTTIALRSDPRPEVVTEATMAQAFPSPLTADFDLVALPDGTTRIDLECRYGDDGSPRIYTDKYVMWVTADGVESKVAEWYADPGSVVTMSAITPAAASTIESVDIRTVDGLVILAGKV